MMELLGLRNFELVDGTVSGFTDTALTDNSTLYLIRTTSGGTDGYARINGKNYMKDGCSLLHSDRTEQLSDERIEQVFRNIGWVDQTTIIVVSGLPTGETATVTVACDGETTILSGNTQYQTMVYMYCPYTVSAETKTGYVTPEIITGTAQRDTTVTHVLTYQQNNG